MENLNQKVAIVTGASRGMGAAIAKELGVKHNTAVVVNYAGSKQAAEDVVAEIVNAGGKAVAVQGDVSKSKDVKNLYDVAEKEYGKVDILVNNAGKAVRKPLVEFTEEEYDNVVDINLKGVFLNLSEASRRMKDNGSIINISASFQGAPIPGYSVYAASKMAIEKITEVAAKELGQRGIRVNSLRPGPTRTDLFMKGKNDEIVNKFASMSSLGRIGEPEDIANVVSFLVEDKSSWVTGQAIGANGGYW
ncbi:SDR family oxidoreductase [Ulvibacterium sp.]|uniref:SDR family oxidoreductase n=1 Tax=Ulvibacterium sp. TaxID=2665914 RepID=UPI00261063A6|nr:SDR family oxidoreductase [Ulvibacterium sp.]